VYDVQLSFFVLSRFRLSGERMGLEWSHSTLTRLVSLYHDHESMG